MPVLTVSVNLAYASKAISSPLEAAVLRSELHLASAKRARPGLNHLRPGHRCIPVDRTPVKESHEGKIPDHRQHRHGKQNPFPKRRAANEKKGQAAHKK